MGDLFMLSGSQLCNTLNWDSFFFIFFLFVVNSVIHWNEKALGSHVFPIPITPPTSLPTRSLQVLPEHQVRGLVNWDSFNRFFPYLHEWFLCNNNTSYKSKKKISFSVVLATCQVLDSYV